MPDFDSASQSFTWAQKRPAYAEIRKRRANKKAWAEDNKKRQRENQPLRTLRQYEADVSPSPPPDSVEQSQRATGMPKTFDTHQPQPEHLPKVKIPLTKTESEHKNVQRSREQIAKSHKSGLSSSMNFPVAGVKRRAEHHDDNISKKSKFEAAANGGHKRRAAELDSGRAKKAKPTSFMDYLKEDQLEKKPAAASGLTAPSSSSKQKVDGQSGGAAEIPKVDSAIVTAKHVEDKNGGTDTTARAKAAVKSPAPATKCKSADQQTGEGKKYEIDSTSSAATIDNKATVAATSKAEAQIDSCPTSNAKAKQVDSAVQPEIVSNPESSRKPVPKLSAVASDDADAQTTKTERVSVDFNPAKDSAPVESNEAQTVEKPRAANSSDEPKPSDKPAATESINPVAGTKRKGDDEVSSPAKKPKLQSSNPKNALHNYGQACFMNASLHVLHSIPDFAVLTNKSSEETKADDILSKFEMKAALGCGGPITENRTKLRDHLRSREERNELKVSPHLRELMTLLSSADPETPRKINPFIFQQVCGTMWKGNEDQPMNGETQQDAHEFLLKLLNRLKKEQPELDIDELLAAQFAEQQVCECGATKTLAEDNCNFHIPDDLKSQRMDFETLVIYCLRDTSKFTDYRCERCGQSGRWSPKDGWKGMRMTKSPEYLLANVPRGQLQLRGNRMEEVKLTNRIIPPMKKISLPSADGSTVHYHMVAMIKHSGRKLRSGHYTTIRKIGSQWWYCDDTNWRPSMSLTRQQVRNHEDGCVFLLKKGGDGEFDGRI